MINRRDCLNISLSGKANQLRQTRLFDQNQISKLPKKFRRINEVQRNHRRRAEIKSAGYFVDSSADKFATQNDVREENAEVSSSLGMPRLLVQHIPSHRHKVRPMRICGMIHG
jgi:hypothetical protein